MSDRIEFLWRRLVEGLRRRGALPLGYERLTPGELARAVASASDDRRVTRLVWEWYYPRRYGVRPGAMSDAEAEALIDALAGARSAASAVASSAAGDGRAQPTPGQSPAASTGDLDVACRLCGGAVAPTNGAGSQDITDDPQRGDEP